MLRQRASREGYELDRFMAERYRKLRQKMSEEGVEVVLISSSTNLYYFTGFNPIFHNHLTYLIIQIDSDPVLVLDNVREVHAQEDSWVKNFLLYAPPGTGKPRMEKDPFTIIRKLLKNKKSLGVEEDAISASFCTALKNNLENREFRNVSPWIGELRKVKDGYEVQCVRNAGQISNTGMSKVLQLANSRVDELTICVEAEHAMAQDWKKRFPDVDTASPVGGPDGTAMRALWCLCPSGPRARLVTDTPTNRQLQPGDIALPRIWTNCNGYIAENERSIVVGKPTDEQRRIYQIVMGARESLLGSIRPGITCDEVFHAAKAVFEEGGYGNLLKHMAGHALGLEWHEQPNFLDRDKTQLQAGMVMTVEPKVYIDGFQYGHSDTFVVTEEGYELLTDPANISDDGMVVV